MKRSVPVESASRLIDEKIKVLGDWRGKTLAKVREIIHEADPEIVEGRERKGCQVPFLLGCSRGLWMPRVVRIFAATCGRHGTRGGFRQHYCARGRGPGRGYWRLPTRECPQRARGVPGQDAGQAVRRSVQSCRPREQRRQDYRG